MQALLDNYWLEMSAEVRFQGHGEVCTVGPGSGVHALALLLLLGNIESFPWHFFWEIKSGSIVFDPLK